MTPVTATEPPVAAVISDEVGVQLKISVEELIKKSKMDEMKKEIEEKLKGVINQQNEETLKQKREQQKDKQDQHRALLEG